MLGSGAALLPPTIENFTLGNRLATLYTDACVWPPTPITSSFLVASMVSACSMSANFTFSTKVTLILPPCFASARLRPS